MDEIYWGVEAELEEQAYRFRSARLADRGFPEYFDAQTVFAYLEPAGLPQDSSAISVAGARWRSTIRTCCRRGWRPRCRGAENSLFNAALTAGFAAQGKRQLRSEMATVSNQVLVARSVDFGDLEAVRVAVEMTHNYMNLALEHLAGGDLKIAIEHLRDTHLQQLFRLGVSLTIDLRKRAETVVAKLGPGDRSDARDSLSRFAVSRGDRGLHAAAAAILWRPRSRGLGGDARLPLDARSPSRLCDAGAG